MRLRIQASVAGETTSFSGIITSPSISLWRSKRIWPGASFFFGQRGRPSPLGSPVLTKFIQ